MQKLYCLKMKKIAALIMELVTGGQALPSKSVKRTLSGTYYERILHSDDPIMRQRKFMNNYINNILNKPRI